MIHNDWLDEHKTIIIQTLSENWSWDELLSNNKTEIPQLMNQVDHEVHIIVSLEDSPNLPSGSALMKGKDAVTELPDNLGLLVIVSPDQYVRVLVDMVSSITIINDKRKLKSASSIAQAQATLLEYEKTTI